MQVASVSAVTPPGATGKQMGELGKEDFLKLLMAQLKNQDPLKPMEDTQFISQMAQFSTLERMQEMNDRMAVLLKVEQLGQANGLIGKSVKALLASEGGTIEGTVSSVKVVDGEAVVLVRDKQVRLSELLSVADEGNWKLLQASGLIGKAIRTLADQTGQTVAGTVDSLKVIDGSVVLMVGDRAVKFGDVASAAEGAGTQLGQTSSLIGKQVVARTDTSGGTVEGVVDSVKVVDGKLVLSVGSRSVKLEDVISITKAAE